MPRSCKPLSDTTLRNWRYDPAKPKLRCDGLGLNFRISKHHRVRAVFVGWLQGKAFEIAIGPYPEITLAQARQKAFECRAMVARGEHPKDVRIAQEGVRKAAEANVFAALAKTYLREAAEANALAVSGKIEWETNLRLHINPVFGRRRIAEITDAEVLSFLRPKLASATGRICQRIMERVFAFAIGRGLRAGTNPASKAAIEARMPGVKLSRLRKVVNHPSLPWELVPQFMHDLTQAGPGNCRALIQFLILTSARLDEGASAVWTEFDFKLGVWVCPAARRKTAKDWIVPLSTQLRALLESLPRTQALVFPSSVNKPISKSAVGRELARRKQPGCELTAHGFRASGRTWANTRDFDFEVKEMMLGHNVGDSETVLAYARRTYVTERRIALAQGWADHCYSHQPTQRRPIVRREVGAAA